MELKDLTPQERAQLKAQLLAAEEAEKAKVEADRQAYKDLVSQSVLEAFALLKEQAAALKQTKQSVYKMFEDALAMKAELYGVKEGQQSQTFTNQEGTHRIILGANMIDNYDDTAETGIEMVREYLDSLGDSENARQAVKMCLSLLAKDKKGTLKASRIMTLKKFAAESGNKRFIEAVEIIMSAYCPIESKLYIRAEYKDDKNEWKQLPLGITEA